MLSLLHRCIADGSRVEVIYMDGRNRFSQRTLRPLAIAGGKMKAYCYLRGGVRLFALDRVLSVQVRRRVS